MRERTLAAAAREVSRALAKVRAVHSRNQAKSLGRIGKALRTIGGKRGRRRAAAAKPVKPVARIRRKAGQVILTIRTRRTQVARLAPEETARQVRAFADKHSNAICWYRLVFWKSYEQGGIVRWYESGTSSTEYYYPPSLIAPAIRYLIAIARDDETIRMKIVVLGTFAI